MGRTETAPGPVGVAVAELIEELDLDEVPGRPVYAQMAVTMAAALDASASVSSAVTGGLSIAAMNRELRETVRALLGTDEGGGGGDGNAGPSAGLLARLSAPLGHTEN